MNEAEQTITAPDETKGVKKVGTAEQIATELGETEREPRYTLHRVVKVLGKDRALALLAEVQEIEAQDGLTTDDGAQRRTIGGVYFKLVKNQTTPRERWSIFGPVKLPPKPKPQPLTWDEVLPLVSQLLKTAQGPATVKVVLVGRPGRLVEKGEVVLTTLPEGKVPALPKGLPVPPVVPVTYLVYIARKQWEKVKGALRDPEDVLIVEGFPAYDSRLKATVIFATAVTTKLLQAAKRAAVSVGS